MSGYTKGPWKWQGEDYRGDWGWQMLVGPNGEGLIVSEDPDGPCKLLRAQMPIDPKHCITGMMAEGKEVARPVHVFSEANARLIAAAPDLLEALTELADLMDAAYNHDYEPDSFTTQPARIAIAKATGKN